MLNYKCINYLNLTNEHIFIKKEIILIDALIILFKQLKENNLQYLDVDIAEDMNKVFENKQIMININDIFEMLHTKKSESLIKKIIEFVIKKNKIFDQTLLVYNEQYNFMIRANKIKKCTNIYYVLLYDNDEPVISMFISTHESKSFKLQMHFFIVKNIYRDINLYINSHVDIILNSSILLHSFASYIFDSEYWCTWPLQSMTEILNKNNIKIIERDLKNPDPKKIPIQILEFGQLLHKNKRQGCFIKDMVNMCVETNQMKYKWNPDNYDIEKIYGKFLDEKVDEIYLSYIDAKEKIIVKENNSEYGGGNCNAMKNYHEQYIHNKYNYLNMQGIKI